jgi:hypothetical protein
MDDEKSITEKLTNAISKAAGSVKSAVGHVIETASDAAQHAMEANAEKIARIPPAKTDPGQVAATTNEQIYIPDAAAMPMPLFPVAPAPKKKPTPNKAAAVKGKKKPAKKSSKKAGASKPSKTAAKPIPANRQKSSAGKNSVGTNKKKTVKKFGKKAKKSKRR